MEIRVWIEDVDDVVGTYSLDDFCGIVPCIGDKVLLPMHGEKNDYFLVKQRFVNPGDHWKIEVIPTSEHGFSFRRELREKSLT